MPNVLSAPVLFFVNVDTGKDPEDGKEYELIPAGSSKVRSRAVPKGPYRTFLLDIHKFFSGDMPDMTDTNEGLLRLEVDTRDPQEIDTAKRAAVVAKFRVRDWEDSQGFLSRGVYRNVLFSDFVNLHISLVELDQSLGGYFEKVEKVFDESGLGELDMVKSIPFLDIGRKLVGGILDTFGKNKDDVLWEERPILSLAAAPASANLRSGIYVMVDRRALNNQPGLLVYRDGDVLVEKARLKAMHFVFSIEVKTANLAKLAAEAAAGGRTFAGETIEPT